MHDLDSPDLAGQADRLGDPDQTPPRPPRTRRPARRSSRASFGSVRQLSSGRFQVRFPGGGTDRQTAAQTFRTRHEAADNLTTVRSDMVRGTWSAPELGSMTLAEDFTSLLAVRVDLAPKTQ